MATISSTKIGIDTGFGHTKYAYFEDDSLKLGKFPSVVAFANDSVAETSDGVHVFEGNLFYVGEMALKQPKHTIRELTTYKDLERFAPLLVGHVQSQSELTDKSVDEIVCGLSPAHKEHTVKFKERISSFEISDKLYSFDVKLLPQGVGAVNAIKYFSGTNGIEEPEDYLVVDIGFNTVDVIFVYDKIIQRGKISEENSFEKRGAINIAEMIRKHIANNFQRDISLKEALGIVTLGEYRLRGVRHDLSQQPHS